MGSDVLDWIAHRLREQAIRVERIPLTGLDDWSFDEATGNLGHRSGRFFTVEGLHVITHEASSPSAPQEWQQPIIVQPEVGILGLLAKEFDGVLHFLMQAKFEPGNPNLVQLSPTVQATRSNYTRVHEGADVRYLDYFLTPGRGVVVTDVLQSEHGSWFFRKVNRNMIVEVREDVPLHEDFCWLTLGELGDLLRQDLIVNMDARTVMACAPATPDGTAALHSDTEVRSWFVSQRSRRSLTARTIPLARVSDWTRDEWSIQHSADRYFRVMAVSVKAGSREAPRWSQPLIEPLRRGVAAFLIRRFRGVPHLLAHARVEGGFLNVVELGPTVQCTPEHYGDGDVARPPFLDVVLGARPDQILYTAVHSEEGGRFLNADNHYLIVEADESQAPESPPDHYFWVTAGQLRALLQHGHYVNMQARTLLAAINSRAVDLHG